MDKKSCYKMGKTLGIKEIRQVLKERTNKQYKVTYNLKNMKIVLKK